MKFVFTKHARGRIRDFANHGLKITKGEIIETIKNPEHIDKTSDATKIIASRPRDTAHILRVVFKVETDIIRVITVYPAKKGRYYETK